MAITGKPSLAYIGVEAATPPNMVVHSRDPNTHDLAAYRLGDFWLNKGTQGAPLQRLWVLTSKAFHTAQWALIIAGGGGATLTITPDGGAPVSPVLGNITINNTDGNIVLTNGGPGLIIENFANSIVIQNNITTVNGFVNIGSRNPAVGPILAFSASNAGGAINAGGQIGNIFFNGFNGVGYQAGAAITATNDVAGVVALMPAHLEFWTKPNSVNPLTARMLIASTGDVIINAPDSGVALTVNGEIVANPGAIRTINANIYAQATSDTPPNAFATIATVLTHVTGTGAVAVGDIIGSFSFLATTAAGVINIGAAISSVVTAAVGVNLLPVNLIFSTHPNAVRVPPNELIQRMIIASTGEVTINAPDSGVALTVNGEIISNPGPIRTVNGNILAEAISDTPPNAFATVGTVLTHATGTGAVAVGDGLGAFSFLATTALGTINTAASISSAVTAGTVGVNQIPASLVFSTHPDAVRVPPNELLARVVIASTGAVAIATKDAGTPPGVVTLAVGGSVGLSGDDGGILAGNTFTGIADVVTPNAAGTFTIKSKSANNLDSTGFIKIYVNNVAYFIPVFNSTAP